MFDVRFDIKPIDPVMIKNEAGEWINLQHLKAVWSTNHQVVTEGFVVLIQLAGDAKKDAISLKTGFESREQADKYIDDLFCALHSMSRRGS